MKIAFFSNFLNHHQLPMCKEFMKYDDTEFIFVATEPIPDSRLEMGYDNMNEYPFVLRSYESDEAEKKAIEIANSFDIVIWGAAPRYFVKERIKNNKITFRFTERLFKKGLWRRFIPTTRYKIYSSFVKYKGKQLYILCASSYTASDFSLCGFDNAKCFKWGYFPEIEEKNLESLFEIKEKNEVPEILYAGRLLHLKHVIDIVKAVHKLKEQNIPVHFTIIGDGESAHQIKKYIAKNKLEKEITMLPFMPNEEVREYMDKADIFVFSSNFYEGWGAVINEAMNSACAIVESHAVGSAKYLITDGENGYIYRFADVDDLAEKIKKVATDSGLRKTMGENAYKTISEKWSAEVAVERLLNLYNAIKNNQSDLKLYEEGPISPAE